MRKAIFLDRDGVINEMIYDAVHGLLDSPRHPRQFKLLPGVGEAIRTLNKAGWLILVVSNQPGVAKGTLSLSVHRQINKEMEDQLAAQGAHINGAYYCLHHPYGTVPLLRKKCSCRKPEPGLLIKAGFEWDIDLTKSYMIGDSLTDIAAGKAVGCTSILLGSWKCDLCRLADKIGYRPDFIASDLKEAVQIIKTLEGENYANFY
jgi:histidinol-phosphate phosphatase family protein